MQIVKVKYIIDQSTKKQSFSEYSYFSLEPLQVGDEVVVPVKDTTGRAVVTAIDVPQAEIQPFINKVKTIPAGSKVQPAIPEGKSCDESWKEIKPLGSLTDTRTAAEKKADATPLESTPSGRDINAWRTGEEEVRQESEEEQEPDNLPPEYPVCTCGMCPKLPLNQIITGAFHDTNPDKRIPQRELCQWHRGHGIEGLHYNIAELQRMGTTEGIGPVRIINKTVLSEAFAEVNKTTAVIKVGPEHDPAVIALSADARRIRDYAVARMIVGDADLKPATDDLSVIAKIKKALTEKKADYLKPIKAHVDAVNAAFSSIMSPLEEADQVTRQKVLAYNAAVAKRQSEAEEINRKKAELARQEAQFNGTGEITIDTTPVVAPAPVSRVKTDMGTTSTFKVTKWEVVDFAAVPDQYKIIDAAKVTKLVKAGGSIPGICVYEEESLRVTAR
ncbi:MAG: hypothetical protein WC639_04775 [Patescibacteria group bacterium]